MYAHDIKSKPIKDLLAKYRIKQSELSRPSGITVSQLNLFINCVMLPSKYHIAKIRKGLLSVGIPLSEINLIGELDL